MKQQEIIDNIKGFYFDVTEEGVVFSEIYKGYFYGIDYVSYSGAFELVVYNTANEYILEILTCTYVSVLEFVIDTYDKKNKDVLDIMNTNESLNGY